MHLLNTLPTLRQIWVAEGTYYPTKPVDPADLDPRARTFLIKRQHILLDPNLPTDLAIFGGFAGNETSRNQRDPLCHLTILSGDLNGDDTPNFGNRSDNAYHVVTCLRTHANSTVNQRTTPNLDGFIIEKGNAAGAPQITLKSPGTGQPDDDVPLSANSGGGMIVIGRLSNPEFSNPNITRCIFRDNMADVDTGYGGGVFLRSRQGGPGTQQFLDCTFHDNIAWSGGAVAFPPNQDDSDANRVAPRLANCLFHHNTATLAGAMYASLASAPYVKECTVAQNHSLHADSGALFHEWEPGAPSPGGTMSVHNSVVWANIRGTSTVDAQAQVFSEDDHLNVRNSDVQAWTLIAGQNNTNVNPQFNDTTGPAFDFRLQCASPVIDYGSTISPEADVLDLAQDDPPTGNPLVGDLPELDQAVRIGNAEIDLGAYEISNRPCDADIVTDGVVNIDDLTAVILQWSPAPPDPSNCPVCSADIVPEPPCQNNRVDIDDLTFVILQWGRECTVCESKEGEGGSSMMPGGNGTEQSDSSFEDAPGADLPTLTDILYNLPQGASLSPDAIQALLDLGIQP